MSDAALHAAADQLGEEALRENIRHRVEAAGTSFYWAMRLLPRHRREGMYAIYAFCREVDDIADGDRLAEYKLAELARWHDEIEALYEKRPRHLMARALSRPVQCYALRKEDFLAILAGMEMDARGDIRAPDLATLDLYCARVASAVGHLSVHIFGDPGHAAHAVAEPAQQPPSQFDNDRGFPSQSAGSDEGRQTASLLDQLSGAVQQAVEHTPQSWVRRTGCQRLHPGACRSELFERQVYAIEPPVIVDAILQVIEHLQRRAKGVGRRPGGAAFAVQVEQLAPDRGGRITAISHQVVPIAIAQLDRVEPKRVQHVMAVLRSRPGFKQAFAHRRRSGRIVTRSSVEDGRHAVEPGNLLIGGQYRIIGNIVGVSREPVERVHMRPQVAPNQKRSDREILAAAPLARGSFDALGGLLVDYPGAPFKTVATRPPQGEDLSRCHQPQTSR